MYIQLHTPAEITPGYQLNGGRDGPQKVSVLFEENKNLFLIPGIKPSIVQSVTWSHTISFYVTNYKCRGDILSIL